MRPSRWAARGALALVLLLLMTVTPPARAQGSLALGDSITVGAAAQLRAAGYEVDAEVGRSFAEGLAVLRARAPALPPRIVVNLGTNSGVTAGQCAQLLSIVGRSRALTLVTVNIPHAPALAASSNAVLARCAANGGAALLDWAGHVRAHPDAVCADGIHISCGGAAQYARFVVGGAARSPAASSPRPTAAQEAAAAAAARAAQARMAAQRQHRLDVLHGLAAPDLAFADAIVASWGYDLVPVAVRLSTAANS